MTRARVLLLALCVLALCTLACTDLDMDRSGWGWDGSQGDTPGLIVKMTAESADAP